MKTVDEQFEESGLPNNLMRNLTQPKDKGRTEMGEDWRAFNEEERQRKEFLRKSNIEGAYHYARQYGLEIQEFNGGTQLRLQKDGKQLDYFPTSGKIKVGQRYHLLNLETEIKKVFGV